jgi:hypothetical protein
MLYLLPVDFSIKRLHATRLQQLSPDTPSLHKVELFKRAARAYYFGAGLQCGGASGIRLA